MKGKLKMINISIKSKLKLLVIIPLVGFICLGIYLGSQSYYKYNNLKQLEKTIFLASKISLLVHEIQKERGYSTAYLGTKGIAFFDELSEQKKRTNNKKKELLKSLKDLDISKYNNRLKLSLNTALDNLVLLKAIREKTVTFEINPLETLQYYTKINKSFIDSIIHMGKNINDYKIARQFISYEQFLRAKDTAGIERAMGTYTLAQNYFTKEQQLTFLKLVNNQNIYIENFKNYSNIQVIDFFEKIMSHENIYEANRIRQLLLNSINTAGEPLSLSFKDSAKQWFSIMTYKIDKLKEVNDFLLNNIQNDILLIKQDLISLINYLIFFCIFTSLSVVIFGHFISISINDLINNLIAKLVIFFKYVNKEVVEISLFEEEMNDEIMNLKVKELNTKILKSKDLISKNNKFLEESLTLARLYEYALEMSNIILRIDLHRKITYANDLFYKISEYTEKELIGQPYSFIQHPDVTDEEINKIWKSIEKDSIWRGTLKNISKSGKAYYSIATVVPIKNKEGKILEYMGIRQDITEVINLHQELEDTQREIIYKMGEIGETRSKETGNHVKRVAEYSKLLALKSGMMEEESEILKHASPMHDIGKVGIPDSILNKPGKLSADEFEIMKGHSQIGYEMLNTSNRPILKTSSIVAHQHHERYDGHGYPRGLKGQEIHIYGRITAICDVFDALGTSRTYKKAWELNKIIDYFKSERGKHFDPNLTDIFLENMDTFLEIRNKYSD